MVHYPFFFTIKIGNIPECFYIVENEVTILVADEIPKLQFRPNQDEYVYLESTGIIKNWCEQCHQWISRDRSEAVDIVFGEKKQRKVEVVESIRNGLVLIGVGVLILLISQGSILMTPEIMLVIYVSAIFSVVFGFISMFYRRKHA